MKEFVYYVAEEEKIPIILNKILKSNKEQFVIFAKEKKNLMKFFEYFKKYKIPYTHIFSSKQSSVAFKNYNEKKSRVFFITDDIIEKKTFFITSTNQIIHYDIPNHPYIYKKRNDIIKNQNAIKLIHILCNEKESQDFKAIEVFYEKKIEKGIVQNQDIKFPKTLKKAISKKTHKKKVVQEIKEKETVKIKKVSFWSKLKDWFKNLFRKTK